MRRLLFATLLLAFAACGQKNDAEQETVSDVKVGFIFLHDENSTYDKNFMDAARAAEEALGLKPEQVIFKTNIPEGNECYEAAADLADQGCDIVFANSFGHESFLLASAKKHPEVQFCHATGTMAHTANLKNFHNAFASIYEGRYMAGVAAGLKLNEMIENGTITAEEAVIGYVAAFYFEEVISGFSAFYLGARSVCPSATMITLKADSWSDPVKEGQIAQSLIDQGAVLISQHSDNPSPATTAEAAGLFHCGYNSDMAEAAPAASIISARADWSIYLTYAVECVLNGEEIATDWCEGFNEGANFTSPLNEAVAAPGTQEKLDEVAAGLKDGSVHVFAGPWSGYYVWDQTPFTCAEGEWVEESETQSAPYFGYIIDGITRLDA